ncbi:MAG: AAA family ATPase [Limnochordales bacterium]|nr:AAA family ATPase [Limnochordales bacterium]
MRIIRFGVERFGVLAGLTSPRLHGRGMVLLWGLNEAGKSTLLRFFRQLFFGYEKDSEGSGGVSPAGWADLEVGEGRLVRWERRASGRQRRGEVRLLPAGDPARILGNVSEDQFSNIFAIGLKELEELKSLEAVDLGARLYTAAGLGALALRLPEVETELDQELASLIAPRSSKARINAVLSDLNEAIRSRMQLDGSVAEYNQLLGRERELEARWQELEQREEELIKEQARLERCLQAWPHWERLLQARRELELAGDWPGFPADAEARLEEREKAVREAEQAVAESARACQELEERLEKIRCDDGLLEKEELWRQLEEERSRWSAAREEWAQLGAELGRVEERIRAELETLGPGWTEERVRSINTSLVVQAEVEEARRQFDRVESFISEQRRRIISLEPAGEEAEGAGEEGQAALRLRQAALQRAAAALKRLQAARAEWAERRAALAAWEAGAIKAEELARVLVSTDPRQSGRRRVGAGRVARAVAMAVAVMILLAWAGLAWPAAIVGALLISLLAAVLLGRSDDRPDQQPGRPEGLEQRWAEVTQQQQAEGERLRQEAAAAEAAFRSLMEEVAEELAGLFGREQVQPPRPEDHLTANGAWMQLWEEKVAGELRRLERDLALHEDRERQLQEARKALAAAEAELAQLASRWAQVAGRVGVEPGIGPSTALQLIQRVQQIRQIGTERERLWQRRERLEEELRRYVDLFCAAVGESGFPGEADLPVRAGNPAGGWDPRVEEACWAALPKWLTRVAAAREARAERRRCQELLEQAREAERAAAERLARARADLLNLLAMGGTDDPEVFRQRAEQVRRFREAEAAARSAATSLGVLFGLSETDSENVFARVEAELAGASLADLRLRAEEVAAERRAIREQKEKCSEELAAVRQQLASMAGAEARAAVQQREAELRLALREAVERAAVLCLARGMLAEVRRRCEQERQPEVLRRAGFYFARMTGGKYRRVMVPLSAAAAGRDRQRLELLVERQDGEYLSPGQLSRGTAEQLYLSIRLALAEDYARRVAALPLLLDDVLVNFDPRRLGGALLGVAELAHELQILLFTCHPHVILTACRAAQAAGAPFQILMLAETGSLTEASEQEIVRAAANS